MTTLLIPKRVGEIMDRAIGATNMTIVIPGKYKEELFAILILSGCVRQHNFLYMPSDLGRDYHGLTLAHDIPSQKIVLYPERIRDFYRRIKYGQKGTTQAHR